MATHQLVHPILSRALDAAGVSVSGAKLSVFAAGTTTPKTVYTNSGLTTAHASPIVANSAGVWPAIYWDGAPLRLEATDPDDVALPGFPVDDVLGILISATAAADITFDAASAANIASVNVQAAIEEVSDEVRPVARGGTGATTAANARTSLGVVAASDTAAGLVELATDAEMLTGTDTVRAATPAGVQAKLSDVLIAASETASGIVELATTAEATAGTDTARAVTPAGVAAAIAAIPPGSVPAATDTTAGIVELATTAEASAGTDTERAVTPAGVAAAIAASGGAGADIFDLDTVIVYSDTDGTGVPTYTFPGSGSDTYFILYGETGGGGLTVAPASVTQDAGGIRFAGKIAGGQTVSGSSTQNMHLIAVKLTTT